MLENIPSIQEAQLQVLPFPPSPLLLEHLTAGQPMQIDVLHRSAIRDYQPSKKHIHRTKAVRAIPSVPALNAGLGDRAELEGI